MQVIENENGIKQIVANIFLQQILMYFNYDTLECEKVVSCPNLYDMNSEEAKKLQHDMNNDVLNGIGYHESFEKDHLLLTGKRWPYIYEVKQVFKEKVYSFESLVKKLAGHKNEAMGRGDVGVVEGMDVQGEL